MQQANFNSIAASYDSDFSSSKIGIMQRNRVWHHLNSDLNQTKIKCINQYLTNCCTQQKKNTRHYQIQRSLKDISA